MADGGEATVQRVQSKDVPRERRHHHDTHAIPPQVVCDIYKHYLRMRDADLPADSTITDLSSLSDGSRIDKIRPIEVISQERIALACQSFLGKGGMSESSQPMPPIGAQACTVYEHQDFPGLRMYPNLLPPSTQVALVSRLLHRDLAEPLHKTNLHDDFHLPEPCSWHLSDASHSSAVSFFAHQQSSRAHMLHPRSKTSEMKSINMAQFLRRKLRWLTLGAQYDWSTRSYPLQENVRSPFPNDIRALVSDLFPRVKAESGVVLIYSPKDYMPVHRDVSEECSRELCSFSLGCDGIFILALPDDDSDTSLDLDAELSHVGNTDNLTEGRQTGRKMKVIALRVRSGDMLQLSGEARWAWHAMPKVIAGTCPDWLRDWPLGDEATDPKTFQHWKGYMETKRLNISCRQVWDE